MGICILTNEVKISFGPCQNVTDLNATKFMLHLLTDEQKQNNVTVCQDLQENFRDPQFLLIIVTGDM
jgi:hypothetical protein